MTVPYPYPPQRPVRRKSRAPLALALVGVLALALCGCGAAFYLSTITPATSPRDDTAAAEFDRAAFDQYWEQWSETSWGRLVVRIDSAGADSLTAHTSIYPDGDAPQPALSICGAIATFWGGEDRDHATVAVLDKDDAILASKRPGETFCAWRR